MKPVKTAFRYFALPVMLAAFSPAMMAAPITFNTAVPVSDDGKIFRQQLIFSNSSDDLNGIRREVQTWRSVSVLGYGVTRKLAVFGVLPAVSRQTQIGPVSRDVSGFGDASVFARYQIYQSDAPGRTVRVAPFAGLTLPTGNRGQTGDGSVDAFGGLILTAASTDWHFDSQIRYTLNGAADGFERGNALSLDASVQYRLLPREITLDSGGFLMAVLEGNVTQSQMNRQAGFENPNTGGTVVTLSPGLQYATRRWIAETAVRLPVATNLNGTALEPDYSIVTSFRVNF